MNRFQKRLWIGLLVMVALSPLGILLPEYFRSGGAWGEWGPEMLQPLLGYVPAGIKRLSDLWRAPLAGYGLSDGTLAAQVPAYIISGFLGALLAALLVYLISKVIVKR
ncbi:MAG: hypothetical protein PHY31_09800 [Smithellaceae bacterium]|nr:hypothetical protein [Smithellaceae bacterium]